MLAIPNYGFSFEENNWVATPVANMGTELGDPGGAANTKSATTSLIGTGIAEPAYWIQVDLNGTSVTGTDTSALCDIMYDPAGGTSWSVLIPNLICGFRLLGVANAIPTGSYWFPLYIPRGSTIGARWQTNRASPAAGTRVRVSVQLWGGPTKPGFWFGTKVTGVGVDTANSAGLDINPGSTGSYSAWTSIGGTSNPKFGYLGIGVQGTTTAHTADVYYVQYGFGSTKLPGAQIRFGYTTAEIITQYPNHPGIWCNIAAGTQMQVRATGSDATSEDPSVALYGVS